MLNIMLAAGIALSACTIGEDYSRGIGVYPGAPDEYFGPEISWSSGTDSLFNVALHRAAYASSAIDYNHTAHLATDGICDDSLPAILSVSTPDGRLPRREAEWSIDGGPFSRNILMGSHTWLRFDGDLAPLDTIYKIKIQGMVIYDEKLANNGYSIICETSDDGEHWAAVGSVKGLELPGKPLHYKLHSDPNKQEEKDLLPARVLNEEIRLDRPVSPHHLRVRMDMDGAVHWDVREVTFSDGDGEPLDVLPSRRFSSLWMSDGGGEQWIFVDLGKSLPLEHMRLHWFRPPVKGTVDVSDDSKSWRRLTDLGEEEFVDLKTMARYVRLSLIEAKHPEGYALREMEVMSKNPKEYIAHKVAGERNGRYELSGGNWQLQRSSEVSATGENISSAGFDSSRWISATVPGTVLTSFINIGAVPNPNLADNIEMISESFFRSDFWYRDEFDLDSLPEGKQLWLNFDGINHKANVYLNGQYLGNIEGAFMRGRFNVTGLLHKGMNYLAVEIKCNPNFAAVKEKDKNSTQFNGGLLGADNPTFHASVGWDWITTVRGRESGIWNEVYLSATGGVGVSDPYIDTRISKTDGSVKVTPSVFVRNYENHAVEGVLEGYIGDIRFSRKVTIPALSEHAVSFPPEEFTQLDRTDFRLWWPNGYGEPYMYEAGFRFTPENGVPSSLDFKAGLRQMEYVGITDSLRIYINGQRFIPLGGNWGFDEHNLSYRSREYNIAVGYHRDMNFTMIRNWVGQVGDEAFYEACDRNGIMIWQDFWLANPADGPDPYDTTVFLDNAEDYVRRMRNHPSIGIYCGRNEGFPSDALDRKLRTIVHRLSPSIEYISHSSAQGVSGGGPYHAMSAKEYFNRQSGKIHSERGMPNVMNIESLRRTLIPDSVGPGSDLWGKHDFSLQGAQRASEFIRLVDDGFGPHSDSEEFSRRAQLINYNGYRAMFEATSKSRPGLLLWMSHPCWPSLVWQTYDYYFEPTAAYFGVKKACEPLHIQYNAASDSIEIVNLFAGDRQNLTAEATVYNISGATVKREKARIASDNDSTMPWLRLSKMTEGGNLSGVYFLRLKLSDKKALISENTYIMSTRENDFSALNSLLAARPEIKTEIFQKDGIQTALVSLYNSSDVPAVFVRLNLMADDGEQILPAIYSDNYITLMPGEKRSVSVVWHEEDARGRKAGIEATEMLISD